MNPQQLTPPPRPAAADLREGPCGPTFVDAFSCYIRSDHEEKGMDCLDDFKVFQECLKRHPGHVEAIMADAEGSAGGEGGSEDVQNKEAQRPEPRAPQAAPSQ